jgi:hypothetical protein
VRASQRLRLQTESVLHIAEMLEAAAVGPRQGELDRELLSLLVSALRQTALLAGTSPPPLWHLQLAQLADVDERLCAEAACLNTGVYAIAGELWCRQHALEAALTGARRFRTGGGL